MRPATGASKRVAQGRAVIDVAVVGRDVPVMVLSSLPDLTSATATGASLVPVSVMVSVAVSVAPCSSVTCSCDHVGGRARRQVLVGGIAGIEAVAAVGVEGEAGDRRDQRVAQGRAVIDVAVVGRDVPVMVLSSLPELMSATATGASLVPVSVMVSVAVSVAPCSSVTCSSATTSVVAPAPGAGRRHSAHRSCSCRRC